MRIHNQIVRAIFASWSIPFSLSCTPAPSAKPVTSESIAAMAEGLSAMKGVQSTAVPSGSSASVVHVQSHEALRCYKKNRYGCEDPNSHQVVIPFAFVTPIVFSKNGVALVEHEQDGMFFINATAVRVFDVYWFDNAPDEAREGLLRYRKGDKIGFLNRDYAIVIEANFDAAMHFEGGKAKVCQGCDKNTWSKHAPSQNAKGDVFFINSRGERVNEP